MDHSLHYLIEVAILRRCFGNCLISNTVNDTPCKHLVQDKPESEYVSLVAYMTAPSLLLWRSVSHVEQTLRVPSFNSRRYDFFRKVCDSEVGNHRGSVFNEDVFRL